MAVIRRIKAPYGAKIGVKKGQSVTAPKGSLITISKGGRRMPRPRRKKAVKNLTPKPGVKKTTPKPTWRSQGVVEGPINVSGGRQLINIKRQGVDIAQETGTHVRSRKIRHEKAKKKIVI